MTDQTTISSPIPETIEVLKAARELISDPKRWTQCNYARDKNGDWCAPHVKRAVCFCSIGAIARVMDCQPEVAEHSDVAKAFEGFPHVYSIIDFNDSHRHDEVLDLFDAAIARLA